MNTLILTEKPNVSEKIANFLGKVKKNQYEGVKYYEVEDGGNKIYVVSAVGHLYKLRQRIPIKDYPFFDVEWVEMFKNSKKSKYVEPYVKLIEEISKDVDTFVNACDYDIEGSVIGYNALLYGAKTDISKSFRMKFSSLTKDEIVSAYENLNPPDYPMINAGLARHILDWYYGINTSKAMTDSLKKASGRYVTLSAGRVQTPTLKFLLEREKEIGQFVSEPYWILFIEFKKDGITVKASYQKEFFDESEALSIFKDIKNKSALVKEISKKEKRINPPYPFDLGTLQKESYKNFGFLPKRTQDIAQSLYEAGLISYPRTSSQKYPPSLNLRGIMEKLKNIENYSSDCAELLKTSLKPTEGKKDDPAHPAIHPTGEMPKKLTDDQAKLYDLVVRRFLAVFAKPYVYESISVEIDVNGHSFFASGRVGIDPGFLKYYGEYSGVEEVILPDLAKGEIIEKISPKKEEKATKPPARYNPASAVSEMEKLGIGTKATRANIVDILYERNYIDGKQIIVTDLGEGIVGTLEKYCPDIISVELTRHFEEQMEKIQENEITKEDILSEAREKLTDIFTKFKENEEDIGKELLVYLEREERRRNYVGICPICGEGELFIRKGRFGPFIACQRYPDCDATFSLPSNCFVAPTGDKCKLCGFPVVTAIRKRS
ncbi:MAG TPA: DNA topoisomerase I, partial [Methanofastidiosum sp.]|nr:DNA topoisomerase I [Methanofastidiosum sp.]